MSFFKWHEQQVKKNLNMFGLSNYQGFWISFIKGIIFGAVIMWFVGCKEQIVVKKAPISGSEISSLDKEYDYSIGVKGNCGMCKSSIEKAAKSLEFVADAEWGIKSKILDLKFKDSADFDLNALYKSINDSGYETMNTTANQTSYNALPMCCKYDRNMQVYSSKAE